ncbi:MAG: hypothetical protein KF729_17535 [Sandaracinaceae bacterium]|nr:hypothetical protein [Sandaracinaceae bacterium]
MIRPARVIALALLTGLLGGSCDRSVPIELEDRRLTPPEDVDLGTDPWRGRRRMDVDQLRASIARVTGGLAWEVSGVDQLSRFSETLGVPDYARDTAEDLQPSLLFLKFLDDAARSVCRRLVDAEQTAPAEARVFFTALDPSVQSPPPAAVRENLAALLLRYHGRLLEPEDRAIDPWVELLESAAVEDAAPARAWEAVCVALIDHPDFFTY